MKKRYISPSMKVIASQISMMICVSGGVDKNSINNEGSEDLSRWNNSYCDDNMA